jgi:hypothetical protein
MGTPKYKLKFHTFQTFVLTDMNSQICVLVSLYFKGNNLPTHLGGKLCCCSGLVKTDPTIPDGNNPAPSDSSKN